MAKNPNPQALNLVHSTLFSAAKLELAYNSLKDEAARTIASLVSSGAPGGCKLSHLGLRGNRITSEGGAALAEAYSRNWPLLWSIKKLDLRDNCFCEGGSCLPPQI